MKSPKPTPLTPLKASPLSILLHEFVQIHLEAAEAPKFRDGISIRTNRTVQPIPEKPLEWIVQLSVLFGNFDETPIEPAKYTGQITVRGLFQVAEQYSAEERSKLMEITASSILYGACREMLANLTARSSHGMISLPSVTFTPFENTENKAPQVQKKNTKKKSSKLA